MPPAARITDVHTCPAHPPNPILTGELTVFIGYQPAARVSDKEACTATIVAGEPSVQIGGKDAARLGDPTAHGGVIMKGCPTVIIGSSPQAETLKTEKPFCEDCERKKKERQAKRRR
jgi:uncharacterized Zn-binding protein involved in type VI secretion